MFKKLLIPLFSFSFLISFSQKGVDDFTMRLNEQKDMELQTIFIDACRQKHLGNTSESIELFYKCLKINPNSTASMYEMSQLFYTNNDVNGAKHLMENAYKINPSNEFYNLFLFKIYNQLQLYDDAIKIGSALVNSNTQNNLLYFQLAHIYSIKKKTKETEKIYNIYESRFGYSNELYDVKLKFYYKENNFKKFKSTLQTLIVYNPENEEFITYLINYFKNTKKEDSALIVCNNYLKINPNSEHVNIEYFLLLNNKPDTIAAISQFENVINNTKIYSGRKIELLNQVIKQSKLLSISQNEESYLNTIVKVNPEDLNSRYARSEYFLKNNIDDKALEDLYFILSKDKSKVAVFENIVSIESKKLQWKNVYDVSKEALQYFSLNGFFFFYAGYSSYNIEKYNEAINYFLTGVSYISDSKVKGQFYQYLGESYFKLNDYSKCYHFFDKAILAEPTNDLALNNYSYYLSLTKDSLNKALEMTIKSNNLSPSNPIFLDTYAWVLYKLERYSEAITIIKKAVDLDKTKNFEIIEHYGDILFKNGFINEAVEQWKVAIENGSTSDQLKKKIELKQLIE